MKKIKLFALAAFAMLSTNVFAQADNVVGTKFFDALGIQYEILTPYTPATTTTPAIQGTVQILKFNNTLLTTDIEIPESTNNVESTVDIPSTYLYKVVKIDDWTSTNTQFKGAKAGKITIPATISYIGDGAFEGIEATEVVIKSGSALTYIGDNAFKGATKLATFGSANAIGLAYIGDNAFQGTALTAFTFGVDLVYVGPEAFKGTKIVSLDFSSCTKFCATSGTDVIYRWFTDDVANSGFNTNATLTTVKLPASVTSGKNVDIAPNAFKGCTALTTIGATASTATIPALVSNIGAGAFKNTGITKVDMSACAITTIGNWFSKTGDDTPDPSKLQQIILKNDVAYASFSGLTGISTLAKVGITGAEYALPATTTAAAIYTGVFAGTALAQLDLSKITAAVTPLPALFWDGSSTNFGIASLTAVVLNNQTVALDANAFAGCTALESLTIKKANGNAVDDLSTITTVNTAAFWGTKIATMKFADALATFTTPFMYPATATTAQQALKRSNATSLSVDMSACTTNFNAGIPASTFQKVAALTSIKLPAGLLVINANAFEGTGLTSIDLPATIAQNATAASRGIKANAFKGCTSLTKMSFYPAPETASIFFDNTVFDGCSMVGIYTTATYAAKAGAAPTYSKWVTSSQEELTTVKDKVHPYAMKGFYSAGNYRFDAEECQIYEGYIDGENIIMSPLQKRNGKYNIPANNAVIIRTAEATTLQPQTYTPGTGDNASSMVLGRMVPSENKLQSVLVETARSAVYQNYMYVLVNNATYGFSFQHFTGTKINKGNIYVINPAKAPAARLNIVWLDENGNVENDATAIQAVEAAETEDGAIYNLQGVRVKSVKKGLYIKNGKKFIVK